jgi:superfamily I DNA/RNA helicase
MTPAQLEIAQGVLKPGGRICIVGDNRQAIFAFRGADATALDRLKINLNAAELGLTTTYRCGKRIVELAQELVPDFEAGENNPEGEILDIPIEKLKETASPGDFILSRVNAPLVGIAMQLLQSGKRTKIAGRDIGRGLVTLVMKFRARSVPDFLVKVENWLNKEKLRLEGQMAQATNGRKNTLKSKLEGIFDQAEMLTSLADGAKSIDAITLKITDLFTDDGLGEAGMITCSSIHRAKGKEAERVFILRNTLRDYNEEEQNLQYVAITRAKKTLIWVN